MQPHERCGSAADDQGAIRSYLLEGLLPTDQVLAFNMALGTITRLGQHEQGAQLLVLGQHQVTERERDLLLPRLPNESHFVPYEVLYASFCHGYDLLTETRVIKARARLETLREVRLWDAEMCPIRNVMTRLRLKVRVVGLDSINVHETGYLLITYPKWPTA